VSTPLDLWLVRSIQHKGISLNPGEDSLTPLNRALVSLMLFPLAEEYLATYVMLETRNGQTLKGFIQIKKDWERDGTQVVFLSPAPAYEDNAYLIWPGLLEYASLRLADLGVKRIFANVPVGQEEPFRRAGFTVYAREDLYLLEELPPDLPEPKGWRPVESKDKWSVQRLYRLITPPPVQQMENRTTFADKSESVFSRFTARSKEWVIQGQGEIKAYCRFSKSGKFTSLRFTVHPESISEADGLIGSALALANLRWPPPYAAKVRNYEGGIRGALERWGFRLHQSYSLMVRHTLALNEQRIENVKTVKEMPVGILPIKSLQSRGRKGGISP